MGAHLSPFTGSQVPGLLGDNIPVVYFNDFVSVSYCPDLALSSESDPAAEFSEVADRGHWLVTRDAAPTLVVADDEPGGLLVITTGSSANDFCSCQLNGEPWKVQAGKDLYFETRIKVDDSDDTQWFIGLATTDVTGSTNGPILDGTTESIGFRQATDTGVDIYAVTEDASTETTTDTGINVADDTYVTLAFKVTGKSRIEYFVNGVSKAVHTTNIPESDAVTLTMEVHSPTASSTLEVDYIYCSQQR